MCKIASSNEQSIKIVSRVGNIISIMHHLSNFFPGLEGTQGGCLYIKNRVCNLGSLTPWPKGKEREMCPKRMPVSNN